MFRTPEEAGWERVGPRSFRSATGEHYEFPPTHPHIFVHQIDGIEAKLDRLIKLTEGLPAMQKQISDLLAVVAPLTAAVQALVANTAAENATIADLNAKLQAGTALGPDDVQALADASNTIAQLTANLTSAAAPVPAASAAAATAASVPNPVAATPPAAPATPTAPAAAPTS